MQRWNYLASIMDKQSRSFPKLHGEENLTCKRNKHAKLQKGMNSIFMYGIQQGRKHHGLSSRKNIFHFWGKIQIMATIYNLRDNERIKHPRRKKGSTVSTNSSPFLFFSSFFYSSLLFSSSPFKVPNLALSFWFQNCQPYSLFFHFKPPTLSSFFFSSFIARGNV